MRESEAIGVHLLHHEIDGGGPDPLVALIDAAPNGKRRHEEQAGEADPATEPPRRAGATGSSLYD
jgi:hypothetical protein